MPGVIQDLEIILNKAGLDKTIADAKFGGQEIARALVDTPAVKKEMKELTDAMSSEISRAVGRAKMDMSALATASGEIRQAVHPMAQAMSQAAAATSGMGGASRNAGPLVNQLRGALTQLAAQATNVPGPLGQIASRLLQFSAGGPWTLGIVAGLGLIALAWREITRATREAREEADKVAKETITENLGRLPERLQITADIIKKKTAMATQKAEFEEIQKGRVGTQLSGTGGMPGLSDRQKELLRNMQEEGTAVARLTEKLGELKQVRETAAFDAKQNAFVPMFEEAVKKAEGLKGKVVEVTDAIVAVGTLNDEIIAQGASVAAEAITTAGQLSTQVADQLTQTYGEQNAKRLEEISQEDSAEGRKVKAMIAANLDLNNMLAEWDKEDADRKRQNHIEHMEQLVEIAAKVEGLVNQVLSLGESWGLIGEETSGVLSNIAKMGTDAASFGAALAKGDVLGAISSGIAVVGDIGSAIGIHGSKDAGRMAGNAKWYSAAISGDATALEYLKYRSGRFGLTNINGEDVGGWATKVAQDDAFNKYNQAVNLLANKSAADDAAEAAANAPRLAEEKKRAELEAETQRQEVLVEQHELVAATEHKQGLINQSQTLGEEVKKIVMDAVRAQQAADLLAHGPLGKEGPLAREAQHKADEALRAAEKAVEDAQEAKDKAAGETGKMADTDAGFTVQRTITESSAGRVIGELTTIAAHTSYLPKIFDLLSGNSPMVAGGTAPRQAAVYLDGEQVGAIIEPRVSQRQHGRFQNHGRNGGHAGMRG